LLDRTVVRRYLKYESVHPVLRCEAPVSCAHSLNTQTQPRRQTEEAEQVYLASRRMQRWSTRQTQYQYNGNPSSASGYLVYPFHV